MRHSKFTARQIELAQFGCGHAALGYIRAKMNDARLLIAIGGTAAVTMLSFFAAPAGSTYRYAFIFLGALIWLIYFLRGRIFLHPLHYTLFVLAVLLHNLGVFGFYRREFFTVEFDTYVHFYFGFAGAFLVNRALNRKFGFRGWFLVVTTTITILGCGAVHELIEYSTLLLGPKRAMLKPEMGEYDTQDDLLNNMLGSLLACAGYAIYRLRQPGKVEVEPKGLD